MEITNEVANVCVFCMFTAHLPEVDSPAVSHLRLQTSSYNSRNALHESGSHQGTHSHIPEFVIGSVVLAVLALFGLFLPIFVCVCVISNASASLLLFESRPHPALVFILFFSFVKLD